MIIKTRAVADRGRARRDQAAPSLRAAGAARAADRGRQRRILRLDRERNGEARAAMSGDASCSPSIRARPARAPSCSTTTDATMRHRASAAHADLSRAAGEVEHDPEEIWRARCSRSDVPCSPRSGPTSVVAIGITNQRETTVVWERATGKPSPMPSSGRTAAPPSFAPSSRERDGARMSPKSQGSSSILISRRPSSPGCCGMFPGSKRGPRGRGLLRHRRQLPAVQADRRQAACNRRDQRRAHHALRHQVRPVGRAAARPARRAARHAAGGARQPEPITA